MASEILTETTNTMDADQRKLTVTRTIDNSNASTKVQRIPQEALNLLAGGISGMIAKSFVAPIDRIKILYQVTNVEFRLRNVPGVAYTIANKEGPSALWKGNTATMLRVFPYSGVQFMIYDSAKRYILKSKYPDGQPDGINMEMSPYENLFAGMCAGTVSVLCTYPLDLTRAQLAVLGKEKHGLAMKHSIKSVFLSNFKQGGIGGLFRGIAPTMIGIMPYSGLAFTINEQSKNRIRRRTKREPNTIEKLQCGAISGVFAQSVTYPLEVTRRRMQTHGLISANISDNLLEPQKKHTAMYNGSASLSSRVTMLGVIKSLYKEEGMAGFVKGLSMNWIKGPIAFSISFTTYDLLKGFLYSNDAISISPVAAKIMEEIVRDDEGK